MDVLTVENLSVSFYRPEGEIEAVKNVSFSLREGEILAIMGECAVQKHTETVTGYRKKKDGAHLCQRGRDYRLFGKADAKTTRQFLFHGVPKSDDGAASLHVCGGADHRGGASAAAEAYKKRASAKSG